MGRRGLTTDLDEPVENVGSKHLSKRARHRKRLNLKFLIGGGAAFSALIFLWTQLSMLFYPGWGWASFRNYYQPDQLSNFAVVVNVARGHSSAVEPFTETGTMVDPHLYLQLLGFISRFSGIAPADVWNLVGIALQVVLVLCISLGAAVITRRWWAACLGALPLLVGTLSFGAGGWYTLMRSSGWRIVPLWGAFAEMFPLNSGSAALAIAGSLTILLLAVATLSARSRVLMLTGIIVGAGFGLLANIDTYSFLMALFFAIYGLSAYAIAVKGRWWPVALTIVLIVVLFQVGPPFASSVGRLATLVLGLVPAFPGIAIAIARWRMLVIGALVTTVAAAAPQVVNVLIALKHGNAFLKYREASTVGLGVSWRDGLLCAAPLLIPLVMIFMAGIQRRRALWIAYSAGSTIAWLLLAKNDVWGTNQEPYQLWIDGFALAAFTIVPIAVDVALTYFSPRVARSERPGRSWRIVIASLTVITIGVGAVSSIDWFRFYKSQEGQTTSLSTPIDQAMKVVTSRLTNHELVMTDPCIDPEIFKVVTGAPVDYYSLGFAWPSRIKQINVVATEIPPVTWTGVLKPSELRAAGIGWMVTDRSCKIDWAKQFSKLLTRTAASRYGPSPSDVITLWRLKTIKTFENRGTAD